MKALGTSLIALAGLATLLGSGPFGLVGALADGQYTLAASLLTAAWWLFWAALAGGVVMRLSPSLEPGVQAVRSALGESASARAAAAARRALAGGAVAGGVVLAVGALLVLRDVDGRDGSPWNWVVAVSLLTALAVVAASAAAAMARPPAPLTDALRGADDVNGHRRGTSLLIIAVAAAFGLGALVAAVLADAGIAGALAALGCGFALAWGAWEWVARRGTDLAPVLLARAARRLGARGGQVGAILADEALARRRIRGRGLLAAISFLAMVAALSSVDAGSLSPTEPRPAMVVGDMHARDGGACDGACVDGLARGVLSDPAVAAAIVARRGSLAGGEGCAGTLLAVDPAVVRGFSADLAAQADADQTFAGVEGQTCQQTFPGLPAETAAASPGDANPFLVSKDRVGPGGQGEPDAIVVYPASDERRADAVSAVARVAGDRGTSYVAVYAWDRLPYATARFAWMSIALVVALLLVPLGALLTSAVADRRRPHATLAALGASVTSLRGAIAIDATVRAWSAALAGIAAGVVVRVIWSLVGSVAGPIQTTYSERLTASLGNIGWSSLGALALVALGLAALISIPAALSLSRRPPAEALRADLRSVSA